MIKTNPLSTNDIKLIAKNIRKEFNIKFDDAFPILEYLDFLFEEGLLSIQILADTDRYLGDKIPGIYNTVDNFIYLKESVITEHENGIYRANFTLAHELFHYLQTRVLCFDFEEVEDCKCYEEIDWQANEFAGQLLLPSEFLEMDDENLSSKFKVSLECVLTRKLKAKKRGIKR